MKFTENVTFPPTLEYTLTQPAQTKDVKVATVAVVVTTVVATEDLAVAEAKETLNKFKPYIKSRAVGYLTALFFLYICA